MHYTTLALIILLGSLAVCLLPVFFGMLKKKIATPQVPMFPEKGFPALWEQLLALFFFLIYTGATALPLLSDSAGYTSREPLSTLELVSALASQILIYLPLIILCIVRLPWRPETHIGLKRLVAWLFLALAAIIIPSQILESMGFLQYVAEQTGSPLYQDVIYHIAQGSTGARILLIIMAVIVAPLAEECCFRGILYNILKHWGGAIPAMLASALLFSAVHVALPQAVPLFLFGMVQCMAYERAKTLWLPIAIHAVFNALSVLCVLILFT